MSMILLATRSEAIRRAHTLLQNLKGFRTGEAAARRNFVGANEIATRRWAFFVSLRKVCCEPVLFCMVFGALALVPIPFTIKDISLPFLVACVVMAAWAHGRKRRISRV